jgi:predicted dehydrogenase
MPGGGAIGVGAIGVRFGAEDGLLAGLPSGDRFRLVAYTDEGDMEPAEESGGVPYYADYNVLLRDPAVELVLVEGALETRRDSAVRALNAGRHVVLQRPFTETALDAERVMKTALRRGLVATMDMAWRGDSDLCALQTALALEEVSEVTGLQLLWYPPEQDPPPEVSPLEVGFRLLDQVNLVAKRDVRDVSTHPVGPDGREGFLLYLSLRGGGWTIAQAFGRPMEGLPRWLVQTPGATLVARDGVVKVAAGGETRTYTAPSERPGFWESVYAAVRGGAELSYHPVGIVRAMKLHEAALASLETGEPEVI